MNKTINEYILGMLEGKAFPKMRCEESIADAFIGFIKAEKLLSSRIDEMRDYFGEKAGLQSRWFCGTEERVQLVVKTTSKVVSDGLTEEEREEKARLEARLKELKKKEVRESRISYAIGNIKPIEVEKC